MRIWKRFTVISILSLLFIVMFIHGCSDVRLAKEFNKEVLLKQLEDAQGKRKVDIYNKLAYLSIRDDYSKTDEYIEKAEEILNSLDYDEGKIDCINKHAFVKFNQGNLTKAMELYNRALEKSKDLKYGKGQAEALNGLGKCYQLLGEYQKAWEKFVESKDICEKYEKDQLKLELANSFHGIAVLYFYDQALNQEKSDYNPTLKYFEKALVLRKEIGALFDVAFTNYSLGEVYQNNQEFDVAQDYLDDANELNKKYFFSDFLKANILQSEGDIFRKKIKNRILVDENQDKLLNEYYLPSLGLFIKINNTFQIVSMYQTLGDYFNDLGDLIYALGAKSNYIKKYEVAVDYLTKAQNIVKDFETLDTKMKIAQALAKSYKSLGKVDLEMINRKEYEKCKKILSKNRTHIVGKLYGLELKEEQERSGRKFFKTAFTFTILLTLIIMMSLFLKLKDNRKLASQKRSIEEKNSQLEQKRNDLEKSYEALKMLNEIGKVITSSLSEREIYDKVYSYINELMDSFVFWIYRYDEKFKNLVLIGGKEIGLDDSSHIIKLTNKKRPAVKCFLDEEIIKFNDYQNEYLEKYHETAPKQITGETYNSHIFLCLFLEEKKKKKKKIGLITVQSTKYNAYNDYHVNILKNIGGYAAIAIDNTNTYNQLEEEKKKTEDQRIKADEAVRKLKEYEKKWKEAVLKGFVDDK